MRIFGPQIAVLAALESEHGGPLEVGQSEGPSLPDCLGVEAADGHMTVVAPDGRSAEGPILTPIVKYWTGDPRMVAARQQRDPRVVPFRPRKFTPPTEGGSTA